MFTITHKLHTIVALGAVGAALAGSGVASAATVVHKPGTGMTVLASQPTTVAQDIDPSKVGAGGSGQSTDEQCEALANEINSLNNDAQSNLSGNDLSGFDLAVAESALASEETQRLNDNCLVID